MKPQTYLRLSLLIPYLLWAIMFLLTQVGGVSEDASLLGEATEFLNVGFLAAIFLIGILFWFLPYTLLALGLLVWSMNKKVKTVVRVFVLSPLMLAVLMLLEINLLSIILEDPAVVLSQANLRDLMSLNLLAIGFTLGAGYFCVALGVGIYKLLQHLKVIKEPGVEIQPVIHEAV